MTISYSGNFTEFNARIKPGIDAGLSIVDVEYDGATWYATLNDNGRSGATSYNPDLKELEGQINERWSQGYSLLDVEYGDGIWYATFERAIADDTPRTANGFFYDPDPAVITNIIEQQEADGLDLYDIEYGDGFYSAIFLDELEDSTYTTSPTVEDLSLDINAVQAEGYDLVDVEYTGDGWISVFHNATGPIPDTTYSVSATRADFFTEVDLKEREGYDLVDLEYGANRWIGVYHGALNTGVTDSDPTAPNGSSPSDTVNQNLLLDNSHFAFDPGNYF